MNREMLPQRYGQVAYEEFQARFPGLPGLPWHEMSAEDKSHWDGIAQAVADYIDRIPR
jgi:hypothetical protein